MHTVAYIFRRKPGVSLAAFLNYYEKVHGPAMVQAMRGKGLISYDHYPTRPKGLGDEFVPEDGPAYDAISIYVFESGEAASMAWQIAEVIEDSRNCMDVDSMLTLPITHRRVFPV